MSTTIGRLRGILTLSSGGFEQGVTRSVGKMKTMEGASVQLSRRVRGVGASMIASTVGVLSFGAALTKSIRLAADMQETQSRFNAVFGDQSQSVGAWADAYTKAIGRSRAGTLDSLSSFQGFFVGLGIGNEEAAGLSTTLQKLAVDFASFNNLTDQDAQGRFISALSGSSEVLARYGINTKQAAIEQELLAMGVDKAWSSVTEQEKAIARLSVIYKSMTSQGAVGDAARTMDSFANKQKAAAAVAENLATRIGSSLLPAITPMLSTLASIAIAIESVVSTAPEVVTLATKFAIAGTAIAGTAFAAVKLVAVTGAVVRSIRSIVIALEAGKAIASGGTSLAKTLVGLAAAATTLTLVTAAFATVEDQAAGAKAEIEALATAEFDAANFADQLSDSMEGVGDASSGAQQQLDQLQSQLDQITLSKLDLTIKKLQEAGATAHQIDQGTALLSQIAEAEERQKLLRDNARLQEELEVAAARVFDNTRTPLERFRTEVEKLKELFAADLLDADTFTRALEQARELLQTDPAQTARVESGVGALERGTQAAFSAIQQSNRDQEQNRRLAEIRDEVRVGNGHLVQMLGEPAVLIEEVDI